MLKGEIVGQDNTVVPYEELFEIGCNALKRVDVPEEDARTTLKVLLCADLRGVETHGIQRLTMYIPRIRQNLINPRPDITVKSLAPSMGLVAGDDGLGPVVASKGIEAAIQLAKDSGLGFVGCRGSNHFGAVFPYLLEACAQKLICLGGTNAFPTMAPWGGLESRLGNNPLAVGEDWVKWSNSQIAVGIMVENEQIISCIEEVMAIDGLDYCLFGPADYCMSLGLGAPRKNHPQVAAALEQTIAAAAKHGKAVGIGIGAPWVDNARKYIDMGCRFLELGHDLGVLRSVWQEASRAISGVL